MSRGGSILVSAEAFKIPELHDATFLESIPRKAPPPEEPSPSKIDYGELKRKILQISGLEPQPRGYAFEKVLTALFLSCGLAPRGGFRNCGEQIDGSFELNGHQYLLEAKWKQSQTGQAELLAFQGKVEGKADWTRGLFVSYSGFTPDGLIAFSKGRPTRIICVDGLDLWQAIEHQLNFSEVLSRKTRRASESNEAFVSVRDLFPEVQ